MFMVNNLVNVCHLCVEKYNGLIELAGILGLVRGVAWFAYSKIIGH